MPYTDNDTPASESQPAASATPPPVPGGSNQPPSLKDAWNDAKGGFAKLNKEEKTGCGCGIMVLLALCFLLGKCSCSDPSQGANARVTMAHSARTTGSRENEQIEALMQDVFSQGKRLLNVDIFQEDETNIAAGLRVTVSFKMNDYLRRENWVSGIEHDMTNAYASLYQSGLPITKAVMIAYAKTTSSYGEAGKAGVYTTVLRSDEAKKVRWENIHQIDLSKIWETTLRRPDL